MARWGLTAVAVLVVVGIAAIPSSESPPQGTPRFGFVSTEVILRQTPGYAQAESTWTGEMVAWRSEVERLQQQLDSAITVFNQQSIVLSPTARQERAEEVRRLQAQLEQRTNELQVRAEQRRQELVGPLEDRIQRVIDGLRAERNISIIFDVSAPGNNIVSADPVLDLTSVIVRRLTSAGGP